MGQNLLLALVVDIQTMIISKRYQHIFNEIYDFHIFFIFVSSIKDFNNRQIEFKIEKKTLNNNIIT